MDGIGNLTKAFKGHCKTQQPTCTKRYGFDRIDGTSMGISKCNPIFKSQLWRIEIGGYDNYHRCVTFYDIPLYGQLCLISYLIFNRAIVFYDNPLKGTAFEFSNWGYLVLGQKVSPFGERLIKSVSVLRICLMCLDKLDHSCEDHY